LSILLASLGLAGGILLGRAIARSMRRGRASSDATGEEDEEDAKKPETEAEADDRRKEKAQRETDASLAAFPCHLGDVILAKHGEEAWLAGALVLCERLPMAVLFIAPDAGGDRAVLARPKPDTSLLWLAPASASSITVGREPPSSLEHENERFERTRRVPYRCERTGTGAPDLGQEVVFAEYKASIGDRLIVLIGSEGTKAWRGRVLEEGMYDLLPGSPPTETS
jgi:hypothetical protein